MSNKDKTERAEIEKALTNLIDYDCNEHKTEKRLFVSGVNCDPDNVLGVMKTLLERNDNDSDRVAYHAVQSFAGQEVDPETAHLIGVRFAEEMWGENFPVIIATHKNTENVHNHYAICATGFDGTRFHADAAHYRRMREVSDRLCREYGLSVIQNPQRGKAKHIGEVKAEQEGRYTVRGMIRRDMDAAIEHCFTYPQFVSTFQSLGYTLEWRGKYLRIRPDESTKFFRMDKLGEGYTYDDVRERLRENAIQRRIIPYAPYKSKEKPKGLYALYLHYCYLLGALPEQKPNNREAYAAIKEDVKRARMYSEEAKLLGKYEIHTAGELSLFTEGLSEKFKALAYARGRLRNKLRRMHNTGEMQPIKDKISEISLQMSEIRKQMKLCEDIALRSGVIEKVVNTIGEFEKEAMKRDAREKETKSKKELI